MIIQSEEDLQQLKDIGRIVGNCLAMLLAESKAGKSLKELDLMAADYLRSFGAQSAPILMYNFPGHTCMSISPVAAHGIPSEYRLMDGDLLNIDVSAEKNGYFADTGGSVFIGEPPVDGARLLKATKEALNEAIKVVRSGARVNSIGKRIEAIADRHRFEIIENLGSHGVGRSLHEDPEFIASFFDPEDKRILKKNQVITIEPFLATKSCFVEEMADGWSLLADQGGWTAQFEHSIVVTDHAPIILTLPD